MTDPSEHGRGTSAARLRHALSAALAALALCLVATAPAAAQGAQQPAPERGIRLEVDKRQQSQAQNSAAPVNSLPARQKR